MFTRPMNPRLGPMRTAVAHQNVQRMMPAMHRPVPQVIQNALANRPQRMPVRRPMPSRTPKLGGFSRPIAGPGRPMLGHGGAAGSLAFLPALLNGAFNRAQGGFPLAPIQPFDGPGQGGEYVDPGFSFDPPSGSTQDPFAPQPRWEGTLQDPVAQHPVDVSSLVGSAQYPQHPLIPSGFGGSNAPQHPVDPGGFLGANSLSQSAGLIPLGGGQYFDTNQGVVRGLGGNVRAF